MRKTAIFKDDLFLRHDPGFNHPESPERIKIIYDVLANQDLKNIFLTPEFSTVSHETILMNHSSSLVEQVELTSGKDFGALDPDTTTSPESYAAAMLAVGAVVKGVDLLVENEIDNGFALVRPPGHHAEQDRAMGFCLFNNIAIAAHHAIEKHGYERVMIVDWDLHHGNGTQRSFYETKNVLYVSMHQYPYYPGSGSFQETGRGEGEGYTINIPMDAGQGDSEYGEIFNEIVVPVGLLYKPQLILLSTGFDIYHGDPLGGMRVGYEGFGYMTRKMRELACEVCDGRLLATLEGGYNLTGLRDGVFSVLSEMVGEPLPVEFNCELSPSAAERLENSRVDNRSILTAKKVVKKYWNI